MESQIAGKCTGKRVRVSHPHGAYEGIAGKDVHTIAAEQRSNANGEPVMVPVGLKEYIGTSIQDDRGFVTYFLPHSVLEVLN